MKGGRGGRWERELVAIGSRWGKASSSHSLLIALELLLFTKRRRKNFLVAAYNMKASWP